MLARERKRDIYIYIYIYIYTYIYIYKERGGEGEEKRGEQQRAARTRRPFAYFTGNLRASIRQGNCKNGGVIYLSLPPWALSSFPSTLLLLFSNPPPPSSLGRALTRTHFFPFARNEENSAISLSQDKRDLSRVLVYTANHLIVLSR